MGVRFGSRPGKNQPHSGPERTSSGTVHAWGPSLRLYTTHSCPLFNSRRTMFLPIRPRPSMSICTFTLLYSIQLVPTQCHSLYFWRCLNNVAIRTRIRFLDRASQNRQSNEQHADLRLGDAFDLALAGAPTIWQTFLRLAMNVNNRHLPALRRLWRAHHLLSLDWLSDLGRAWPTVVGFHRCRLRNECRVLMIVSDR